MEHLTSVLNSFNTVLLNFHSEIQQTPSSKPSKKPGRPKVASKAHQCENENFASFPNPPGTLHWNWQWHDDRWNNSFSSEPQSANSHFEFHNTNCKIKWTRLSSCWELVQLYVTGWFVVNIKKSISFLLYIPAHFRCSRTFKPWPLTSLLVSSQPISLLQTSVCF